MMSFSQDAGPLLSRPADEILYHGLRSKADFFFIFLKSISITLAEMSPAFLDSKRGTRCAEKVDRFLAVSHPARSFAVSIWPAHESLPPQ
jgi:hypothetical protein